MKTFLNHKNYSQGLLKNWLIKNFRTIWKHKHGHIKLNTTALKSSMIGNFLSFIQIESIKYILKIITIV